MRVKLRAGRIVPGVAPCKSFDYQERDNIEIGHQVQLDGQDVWFPANWFDYVVGCETTTSKPISGANMTPDEIGEQLITNTPDAFAAACNQIAALAAANHHLIGSQGALVEMNKHVLPLLDELHEILLTYAPNYSIKKLTFARDLVRAGTKF